MSFRLEKLALENADDPKEGQVLALMTAQVFVRGLEGKLHIPSGQVQDRLESSGKG